MFYLYKEDIVELRMDVLKFWGEERNGFEDSRIKGKGGFCLGRFFGLEKGKKICFSFIVN